MVRLTSILRAHAVASGSSADPVIKWAGGKRRLRRQLLALVPPEFSRYYEPFLGGGTFFLSLAPRQAVLNDANPDLVQLYKVIRDDAEALMTELDVMHPRVLDEAFYYELRAASPASLPPVKRAARFIYLNKTCYNGLYRVNRAGRFNVPFGRYPTPPRLYNRANLLRVAALLHRAELRCEDFESALAGAGRGDFVYLDPPYAPLTVTASFTHYTEAAFTVADQRRLAARVADLTARGCHVLLSNSDTQLVRDLYADYTIDVVHAPRSINSNGNGRHKIPELAIRNHPLRAAKTRPTRLVPSPAHAGTAASGLPTSTAAGARLTHDGPVPTMPASLPHD